VRGQQQVGVIDSPTSVLDRLVPPLKRMGSEILKDWQSQRGVLFLPHFQPLCPLYRKENLVVVVSQCGEVAVVREIEKFLRGPFVACPVR
jgi:hypothetical protein